MTADTSSAEPNRVNVTQERAARKPFTIEDLQQFVDHANRLGLPDDTGVYCETQRLSEVVSLTTYSTERQRPGKPIPTPTPAAKQRSGVRTEIEQPPSGPIRQYRRRLRRREGRMLLLGDVRALLAKIYDMQLPTESYQIDALARPGAKPTLLYYLSARPRIR
ncbi:hypothetical protein ACIRSS_23970 [Amycolatopsis sp. NPDC101161]|uniref:hypothetical protein n=1 Tax=Amycolatopsis sp. NPDC101161 TaxID=3363940 RepID=UPI00381ADC96